MRQYQLSFYDSAVGSGESSPNAVAPIAARQIKVPTDEPQGYTVQLFCIDGTSVQVTPWIYDATAALWLQVLAATTITQGTPRTIAVPAGALLFLQYGTNTGAVTKFGCGFISGSSASSSGSSIGTVTPSTDVSGATNMLPKAVYNAAPTVRTEGQAAPLQASSVGSLMVQEANVPAAEDNTNGVLAIAMKYLSNGAYSPSVKQSGATPDNAKASAGVVVGLLVRNNNAAIRYLQIHNTTGAVAPGRVPELVFQLPAGATGQMIDYSAFLQNAGFFFGTGITAAISTTEWGYTAGAGGEVYSFIAYV